MTEPAITITGKLKDFKLVAETLMLGGFNVEFNMHGRPAFVSFGESITISERMKDKKPVYFRICVDFAVMPPEDDLP